MYCPKCGSENASSSKFCMKCGNSLSGIVSSNASNDSLERNNEKENKKNHTLLIVLIVLFVVAFFAFFAIKSLVNRINSFNLFRIDDIPSIITNSNISLPDTLKCEGDNCHEFKVYFLKDLVNDKIGEQYETYYIEDGTVLGTDVLVQYINKMFGGNILKSDGEIFTFTIGEYSVNVGFYYKDTDQKFNFNEPITEDIEIEMKLFDGAIDNDFLKNIYDIFNR